MFEGSLWLLCTSGRPRNLTQIPCFLEGRQSSLRHTEHSQCGNAFYSQAVHISCACQAPGTLWGHKQKSTQPGGIEMHITVNKGWGAAQEMGAGKGDPEQGGDKEVKVVFP